MARLSQNEYLLLGSPADQGQRIADEEARWELDHRAHYLLPRQDSHACVLLSGTVIAQVMAKLCGVDLSFPAFKPGAVAQTAAARINVIVIHSGSVEAPAFHILWDRASKDYFDGALRRCVWRSLAGWGLPIARKTRVNAALSGFSRASSLLQMTPSP